MRTRLKKPLYCLVFLAVAFALGISSCQKSSGPPKADAEGIEGRKPVVSSFTVERVSDSSLKVGLNGENFKAGAQVQIKKNDCQDVNVPTPAYLSCVLPKIIDFALIDTAVTNPDGMTNDIQQAAASPTPSPTVSPNFSASMLSDNPLGYWRLGESSGSIAQDASSYGRNGVYQAIPGLGASGAIANSSDTSVLMNGIQEVDVPFSPPLDFNYNNAFTLEAWIKTTIVGQDQFIMAKQQNSPTYKGYSLMVCENLAECPVNRNVLFFTLQADPTNSLQVYGTTPVNDGAWHHVVATYNGNGWGYGVRLYVDGKLETMTISNSNYYLTTNTQYNTPFSIGGRNGGSNKFMGSIDEAALYNYALPRSRIEEHYAFGKGVAAPPVVTEHRIFVSSTQSNGNLGGLTGADTICRNLAAASSLTKNVPGTWKALLSGMAANGQTDAKTRIVTKPGVPIKNMQGLNILNDAANLWIGGSIINPILYAENGLPVATTPVWTGTHMAGGFNAINCSNFTDGGAWSGSIGDASAITTRWINDTTVACGHPILPRIYCMNSDE